MTIGDRAKVYADMAGPSDSSDQPEQSDAGQTKLGITVAAVPQAVASKLGIQGGVTVTSVTPGSFADDIGLSKGILIIEINRERVTDQSIYNSVVGRLKVGDDVVFVVRDPRGDRTNRFLGGTLR